MRTAFWCFLVAVLLALVITPAGCTPEEIGQLRADLEATQLQLQNTQIAVQQAHLKIAQMPDGPQKEKWARRLAAMEAVLVELEPAVGALKERILTAKDPLDVAAATIETAAPFLPPPWNTLVPLFGGIALGLIRAAQNRYNGRKALRSVQPAVTSALHAADGKVTAEGLSGAQGAGGKRLVDEAQGKKMALPF